MKKLAVALCALVILAATVLYLAVRRVDEPFRGYREADQLVDVPSGFGTSAIGRRLVESGVVRDTLTYRLALWVSGGARHLQAGEYRFEQPMSARDVIGKIVRGEVDQVPITFPEGLTIAEMGATFESGGFGPAQTFVTAASETAAIADVDRMAKDLEGYLFPDTYKVARRVDAARLVGTMVERSMRVLTPELRQAAAERGLTVRQLITLASLVEKETARPEERPLVAAVYVNRLRLGMPLQCDPTVIYALQRRGRFDGNLRRDDLAIDSPYNTYRYPGLPPGPIAAPGKASIDAAAHPADVPFLYFVSRNDGSHEFARSLEEHNRNVQKYQVLHFRAGRASKAGRAGK